MKKHTLKEPNKHSFHIGTFDTTDEIVCHIPGDGIPKDYGIGEGFFRFYPKGFYRVKFTKRSFDTVDIEVVNKIGG